MTTKNFVNKKVDIKPDEIERYKEQVFHYRFTEYMSQEKAEYKARQDIYKDRLKVRECTNQAARLKG